MMEFKRKEELCHLINENNVLKIEAFLKADPDNVSSVLNIGGDSILHYAVLFNKIDIVKLLLEHEVNINKGNDYGITPLFTSTNLEITKLLIDRGGNVNQVDNKGNIPLHTIIQCGSIRLIDLHFQGGAHPLTFNLVNQTPILQACKLSSSKMIRHMMKNGGDLMYCNNTGHNALHIACINNTLDVVKYLVTRIPNDVDVNEQDKFLRTPLHYAVMHNRYDICKILLSHQVNLEVCDKTGLTPLHVALKGQFIKIITLLLNHGALLEYENMRVQLFLLEIERFPQEFILLISFHIFIENHEIIKEILIENARHRTFRMYLTALNCIYFEMIISYSSSDNRALIFPNVLFDPGSSDLVLKVDKCREVIKERMLNLQFKDDVPLPLRNFLLRKYNNGIRAVIYMLIEKKHLQNTTLNKFEISTFTNVLDFLDLNELNNLLKALGIHKDLNI